MTFTKRIFFLLTLLALVCGPAAQAAGPVCGKMAQMPAKAAPHHDMSGASAQAAPAMPCPHAAMDKVPQKAPAKAADTCHCAMSGCHVVKIISAPAPAAALHAVSVVYNVVPQIAAHPARPEIVLPPPRIRSF